MSCAQFKVRNSGRIGQRRRLFAADWARVERGIAKALGAKVKLYREGAESAGGRVKANGVVSCTSRGSGPPDVKEEGQKPAMRIQF